MTKTNRYPIPERLSLIRSCLARPADQTVADWCNRSNQRPPAPTIYAWCVEHFGKSLRYVVADDIEAMERKNGSTPERDIAAEALLGHDTGLAEKLALAIDAIARRDLIIEELFIELKTLR